MKRKLKKIRNKLFFITYKKHFKEFGKDITINHKCQFNNNVYLKDNVNFNGLKIKGKGKVVIGSNFHSGENCLFITSFHNYESSKIPYDETTIDKDIIIEDNVWIGDRVIILGGVKISEGAIIQAGSVVVTNVDKCSIVGGSPAKEFKKRNIEHYNMLKKGGKFF